MPCQMEGIRRYVLDERFRCLVGRSLKQKLPGVSSKLTPGWENAPSLWRILFFIPTYSLSYPQFYSLLPLLTPESLYP